MQVIMAAAGRGQRFIDWSKTPKAFTDINGTPMWVKSITPWLKYGKPTIVFHKDHKHWFEDPGFECNYVWLENYTEGPAETCYKGLIDRNGNDSVVFVDCDSNITFDTEKWDTSVGGLFVMKKNNPVHSYSKIDENGYVIEVKEKEVISPWANTGHFWFANVSEFVDLFEYAYKNKIKHKGEYYIAPLYNDAIQRLDMKFKILEVDKWYCWGTPQDVESFVANCEEKN